MQNNLMYIIVALLALLISQSIVMHNLRRTIDKLTDKILGIQPVIKGKQPIVEEDASPKEDEPKGWYDH